MAKKTKGRDLSGLTVHMIGNAHIDPVWQWRWEEGRQEVLDTCRAAVERIIDTPGFVFCRSSAVTYQWIEETDPELFDEIKRWVARGRWCVVNGWWVQPDCNIPGGESLVRQGLYGQRYFLERFGVAAKTGYNVDTFGHAGTLPQILSKQGMDQYCFFRPDPGEKELPSPVFWWEGVDGTRVLTARMPGHYCTWSQEIEEQILAAAEGTPKGLKESMCFYGVGNHGGGPTKANIASIQQVDAAAEKPQAVFSSPDAYFDAIREKAGKLPVVAEELQYHSRGCYTAVSAIKQHNRRAENMLMQAEKLSCLAGHLVGLQYPADDLEYAWKQVLFNQFHDIMAGTSIRPACDDAIAEYEEAEMLAGRAIRSAIARISSQVDTTGAGRPIVVYNPLSWERTEVVQTEVTWPNHDDAVHIVDETGEPVACQVTHTNISGRGSTIGVAFVAETPSCGYRVYRMVQGVGPKQDSEFQAGPTLLESDLYRLEFDAETGHMTRLVDKSSGNDLLAAPANVPMVMADRSDTWSHGIESFRDEIGCFKGSGGVDVVEVGPVRATVRVEMEWGDSVLVQEISLYRGVPRIDVALSVDYHGQHEMLKIAFPTALSDCTATYETPYGHVTRAASGAEEPAQKWADVSGELPSGTRAGLAVLNDGRYGYDICGGELRLSILRTPIYCFHDPAQTDACQRYEYTDQGIQGLTYSLAPHSGDWREAGIVRQAQEVNHPCLVREEPAHEGRLSRAFSLIQIDSPTIIAEVVKKCEDGPGLVVRMYETAGKATHARVAIAGEGAMDVEFGPCEIKTLLVLEGEAQQVNLLELPAEG